MTDLPIEDFHHDFRQGILAKAEANLDFLEAEFVQTVADELTEAGIIDGFEACYYRPALGRMRVDGYWLTDDTLELFIADFENRETLESLTQTEVNQIFKRLENFFTGSATNNLFRNLEETSQGYGLSRLIAENNSQFSKVNLYLLSERVLSERVQALSDKTNLKWTFSYHIWDISRLYRLQTSKSAREELEIDVLELTEEGLPCLPANFTSSVCQSYLVVMPASVLTELYSRYGSRLLQQNVRSFLQIRGNVNKGIRATILTDPEMFFAYNNGITATAKAVQTVEQGKRTVITSIKDLQIVNGGQTTATLYHAQRKDKASLDSIFVQMKLSVVDEARSEEVVPKISEYANTQNKVNAADFFSNHPFHIRLENFSRRLWAPTKPSEQRETKWFYERARGQYADAQAKLTPSDKKRFLAEYPKPQMFTKTDLAKFENAWLAPVQVNLGAQKNFAHYANYIGEEWEKHPNRFNETYFKHIVAMAIIFRKTERLVSDQPWYDGGYRANIVAYTIGMLSHVCAVQGGAFDFSRVWNKQDLSPSTISALETTAKVVFEEIMDPPASIANISEWAKKDGCWSRIKGRTDGLIRKLPSSFFEELLSIEDVRDDLQSAVKTQKMLNGIAAQQEVLKISGEAWAHILELGRQQNLFLPKEIDILRIATQIPDKLPSEKQSYILLEILERARLEAIYSD